MAIDILLQAGGVTGLVTIASVIGSLPMAGHRGKLKAAEDMPRTKNERELGPPSFEDFMMLWEGLAKVRRSEFYGLSDRRGIVTDRDVVLRVAALCRRAGWGVALERKLIMLARKKESKQAEQFYPGRGFFFGSKSKLMDVECRKVLKHFKKSGLIQYGQPVFEYAEHKDMLARALSARVGKPNEAISGTDQKVVYEFFSLNIHKVATEQGRYDLMKGCAEISTDSKLGLARIKLFQRWGESPRSLGRHKADPDRFLPTDEEYEGDVFMQDDVVYALAFKVDRAHGHRVDNHGDHDHGHASRRNMIAMVLSGMSAMATASIRNSPAASSAKASRARSACSRRRAFSIASGTAAIFVFRLSSKS